MSATSLLAPPAQNTRRVLWVLFVLFIVSALAYGVASSGQDFYTIASIFATRFLGLFIEALPFLLLGTFTSGLIEAFIRPDDMLHYLPKNRFVATIGGAFLGLAFPVCECGVVPVARRLFSKGLPMSVGIAFLLAAPFMNPIVFAATYIAFGFGTVFIGRFVVTALVAISVGLIFALNARRDEVLLPLPHLHDHAPSSKRPTLAQGLWQALNVSIGEFFDMGRYLIVGCLMAAAMQTLISQDALLALGSGPFISVLVLQALAFILSVCSTVDAFLALAFVNTFTTGSIITFLSFGPMVDIKSIIMFTGVFQRKAVIYLVLLPLLMTLLAGVVINLLQGV